MGLYSLLAGLVLIAAIFVVARWQRLSMLETSIVAVLVVVISVVGPPLVSTMTDGRGAISETSPWITLLSIGAGLGWAFWRGRTQRSGQRAPAQPRNKPVQEPAARGHTRASAEPAPAAHSIFISYRRSDSADVTGRIYDRLVQKFGASQVYKDVDAVPLGVDFRTHIDKLVSGCDALIAVIGPSWSTAKSDAGTRRIDDRRDLVRIEIAAALARGIPVVPVLVRGAALPGEQELPDDLQPLTYRNGIPVRADPDFHVDVDRLIKGLAAHFQTHAA